MKGILVILLLCAPFIMNGQIENTTKTVKFEIKDKDTPNPKGYELPSGRKPSLTLPKEERSPMSNFSSDKKEPELLDMMKGDGLLTNDKGKTPKAFVKDKEPSEEFARDQNLGQSTTGSEFVNIKYRDHEYVDGDLIRVFVNGDVVQSNVYLGGSFRGFVLTLEEGVNHIEFLALNQGSSGPNTAELHVYDDKGMIISAKKWNLLTGYKAVFNVIKE